MGLLDYYRKFEDVDQEEFNRGLRERRAREKATALAQVPQLDLSGTEWPDFPHSEVVNASIYAARGRVNGYPDRVATSIRATLAERHEVQPEQIVLGNGAAELLQTTAFGVLGRGDELVTPWPSYPLYPLMAQRAGARPVAVDLASDAVDPEALLRAVGDSTRLLTLCNPNDPTGTYMPSEQVGELLSRLPGDVLRSARRGLHPVPDDRGRGRLPAAGGRVPATCSCSEPSPRSMGWRGCARATRSGRRRRESCWPPSRPPSA